MLIQVLAEWSCKACCCLPWHSAASAHRAWLWRSGALLLPARWPAPLPPSIALLHCSKPVHKPRQHSPRCCQRCCTSELASPPARRCARYLGMRPSSCPLLRQRQRSRRCCHRCCRPGPASARARRCARSRRIVPASSASLRGLHRPVSRRCTQWTLSLETCAAPAQRRGNPLSTCFCLLT